MLRSNSKSLGNRVARRKLNVEVAGGQVRVLDKQL